MASYLLHDHLLECLYNFTFVVMSDHKFVVDQSERAELLNGRVAMLGVIAAIGAYCVTGQLIPGIF